MGLAGLASCVLLVWGARLEAHTGAPPTPSTIWTAWSLDGWTTGGLVLAALLVLRGLPRNLGRRPRYRRRLACFLAGWATLVVGLVSPLDALGRSLFSAHMVQHELLMLIAAPLLVLARWDLLLTAGLPGGPRRLVTRLRRRPAVIALGRGVTRPVVAWSIHAGALWIWHEPRLFDGAVASESAHAAQHVSFLGSSLLFWVVALRASRDRSRSGEAILLIFTTAVQAGVLGALLTCAPTVWYDAYTSTTAAWGLTPLEDQQLGGLIMWVPPGFLYLAAALMHLYSLLTTTRRVPGPRSATATLALVAVAFSAGCRIPDDARPVAQGDRRRGPELMLGYGCGTCHEIPGVPNARARVGPPLWGMADRAYIAGLLPNVEREMNRWLRDPKAVAPRSLMPDMGVTPRDAADMTAYLYSLRAEPRAIRMIRGFADRLRGLSVVDAGSARDPGAGSGGGTP